MEQAAHELLTAKEVAAWLRFTPRRVRQLARDGLLPHILIPTRKSATYRFRRADIEEYLKKISSKMADIVSVDGAPDA